MFFKAAEKIERGDLVVKGEDGLLRIYRCKYCSPNHPDAVCGVWIKYINRDCEHCGARPIEISYGKTPEVPLKVGRLADMAMARYWNARAKKIEAGEVDK